MRVCAEDPQLGVYKAKGELCPDKKELWDIESHAIRSDVT